MSLSQVSQNAFEPFIPSDIALPPISDLLSAALVNETDMEQAIEEWRNKPPDKDFSELLTPQID